MKGKSKQFSLFIHSSLDIKKREAVFNDIWKEFYPKLTVYIKATYPGTETEDIVQEILLKVYSNLHRYNPLYSFNTWIYSIARNCAVDSYRNTTALLKAVAADKNKSGYNSDINNNTPEKIYIKDEIKTGLAACIKNLSEKERHISYLKFYEELIYKEISKIMEIPVGTLKYLVHNMKKKIEAFYRKQYGEQYGD
jgi:RNA polymerase sigma-70 factor (ECF subfamily)